MTKYGMRKFFPLKLLTLLTLFTLFGGCAMFRSDLVAPEVSITGLRLASGDGMYQTLLIDLTILNPNNTPVKFNAISYRVRIEGREVVNGSNHEPLELPAGGSQKYTVPATVNLMSSFGLVRDLISKPKNKVGYELNATLEPSGLFSMPISVRKVDTFSMQ
jgi:LEA14-like dessication related protein